jgi:hypothetical protein
MMIRVKLRVMREEAKDEKIVRLFVIFTYNGSCQTIEVGIESNSSGSGNRTTGGRTLRAHGRTKRVSERDLPPSAHHPGGNHYATCSPNSGWQLLDGTVCPLPAERTSLDPDLDGMVVNGVSTRKVARSRKNCAERSFRSPPCRICTSNWIRWCLP